MKTPKRTSLHRSMHRVGAALGLLALALLLATPALAGHKSHRHRHGKWMARTYHVRPVPPPPARVRPFVVPRVIRAAGVEAYRSYYRGNVYYAPHGHAHAVYSFPVGRDHAPRYEPRTYCEGGLFLGGPAAPAGSSFSLYIAF